MATEPTPEVPLRRTFHAELDELRVQVELMGVRVDQNLERMREVLRTGDEAVGTAALAADDEIDAMQVSLLERCYEVLGLEAPVASDLRFVVSVVRMLSELERVGDLALRVVKAAREVREVDGPARTGEVWDALVTMVDTAVEQYRTALRAWSTQDLALADELATHRPAMFPFHERLLRGLRTRHPDEAIRLAMHLFVIGQAADRIADHAAIMGARLRYLLTGEAAHLAAEVR
jgi:phosphate transport system protein